MAQDATDPIRPMLAKLGDALPESGDFLFEPKWDGFRSIVEHDIDGTLRIWSREGKSLARWFPELQVALAAGLPPGCTLDGEIVIATARGLDFDALTQRVHPAASRIARLAAEAPASFVAFDLLRLDDHDLQACPQAERRLLLEALLAEARAPLHLTPMTTDRAVAERWLADFEGAGLDGVIAKQAGLPYRPGERVMLKIKHVRSADCVVAGLRWHKAGAGAVGSLLLGLYDAQQRLQHVGITSSFSMAQRHALAHELAPLQTGAHRGHPWLEDAAPDQRVPGTRSRWSAGKNLSWEPLRPERVCEVRYGHLQGDRFRHATTFLRWRPDKSPSACRYDQLEVTPPYALARVFGAPAR